MFGYRLIFYEYDKAGQITAMTDPAGVTTCYQYDENGNVSYLETRLNKKIQKARPAITTMRRIS